MASKVARLFEQFRPENYDLRLAPDRQSMTFSGRVTIRGTKAGRPGKRLTFHQKDLKITSATIVKHDKKGDQPLTVSRINNHNGLNEVRLHSDTTLYPGDYTVTMEFKGKITRPMNGIYPCYFKHNGQAKTLIATQFESHYAREAFPCIDEPEAKATFDLQLTSPKGETVIANTPVIKQEVAGDNCVTSFATTPKMSVYLLAFVYGEMAFSEAKTKDGVIVRAYSTPDQVAQTNFALAVAVKGLEFFSDYFSMPYPLPKLDIAALPDFAAGAMENWGLLTFRESAMLIDDQSGGIESKQLVAMVVAHELSHQWFGDLVTMKWWDDLWLNESFANLMEYLAVDHLYPDWQIWEHFVSSEMASAKRRDSLPDVQPIKTDVHHPDEIQSIFDPSIVYAKGGSVLRMLLHYIGESAFQAGLTSYFKKHAYGSTTAADLWVELAATSGLDIGSFMHDWLNRPGYPLVTVDWQPGTKQLRLDQQRFLNEPQSQTTSLESWPVPLAATLKLDQTLFKTAAATVKVMGDPATPLLLNHDGRSYYLPLYRNGDHLNQIVAAIKDGQVDVIDRLLLLDNYTMLQRGGQSATTDLLELLGAYDHETAESVWSAVAIAVAEVRKLIEGDEASESKLNDLIGRLVNPIVESLGWADKPDDSAQTLRLRGLAISLAVGAEVPAVLDKGKELFAGFSKPSDLPASIRSAVYFVGARHGNAADFAKLLKLHASLTSADEKEELAAGLTAAREPAKYNQLLAMFTTDAIRRQDLMHWFVWMLRNRYSRAATWKWLVTNWDWLEREFKSDKSYSYCARYSGAVFSTPAELKQFQDFFGSKANIIALSRDIALARQEIGARVAWRQRNESAVKDWLSKNVT